MATKSRKKTGLTSKIFIALIAGMVLGIIMHYFIPSSHIKDDINSLADIILNMNNGTIEVQKNMNQGI